MMLGKLSVLGHPADLDYSRARSYFAYSRYKSGFLDMFSHLSLLSSFYLSLRGGPI